MKKPKWRFNFWKYGIWYWRLNIKKKWPLLWKDKYETPRLEYSPTYEIEWGYWHLSLKQGNDEEWEWYLWVTEYCNGDIEKAKQTWPWGTRLKDGEFVRGTPWLTYRK